LRKKSEKGLLLLFVEFVKHGLGIFDLEISNGVSVLKKNIILVKTQNPFLSRRILYYIEIKLFAFIEPF